MYDLNQPEIWIDKFEKARESLKCRFNDFPKLAITLGSGLGNVVDEESGEFEKICTIPWQETPGMPTAGVPGHAGKWIIGKFADMDQMVLIQSGRLHPYEGWSEREWAFSYCLMASLGVQDWIFTNAVGGIANDLGPGSWLVVKDHINGMGWNPLRGLGKIGSLLQNWIPGIKNSTFVDLSQAYDMKLSEILLQNVRKSSPVARLGVYVGVAGPSYETPTEIQAMKLQGADVVGMSLVAETILARYLGLRVAALSSVTNSAAGVTGAEIHHQEVLDAGIAVAPVARKIIHGFAKDYFSAMQGELNFR
jgi:purine-nucleoside phosphorylase